MINVQKILKLHVLRNECNCYADGIDSLNEKNDCGCLLRTTIGEYFMKAYKKGGMSYEKQC